MSPNGLIVFGEDWGAHPSSTQHIVGKLAGTRPILWVNSLGMRSPRLDAADFGRACRKLRGALARKAPDRSLAAAPFPVVNPLVLPMARSRAGRALNRGLLARSVGRASIAAGFDMPVLWLSMPSAVDALDAIPHAASVYYAGDDFGALAGVDHEAALELEAELATRVDAIIAASPVIAARFDPSKTRVIAHGVDLDLFGTPRLRPADLPPGPVAGFYGAIAPWIDTDLVAATALLLPGWTFFMIGPVTGSAGLLADIPNVVLAGPRAHADLAAYAQHWTAGLVPFRDTPQIRACNPLKLREYLAAGRPVISTRFPALEPYSAVVATVDGPFEAAAALSASLAEAPGSAAARTARVAGEDWAARAADVAAVLGHIAVSP